MTTHSGIDLELRKLGRLAPQGFYIGLHIRFTSPLMSFQTYNPTWVNHYTENGYVLRDPMTAWGFSTTGTIRWSDKRLIDPFGLFKEAATYGLKYGVTVACGPIRSRTVCSFARDDREFTDEEIAVISAIVHKLHDMTEPPEKLTSAQVEALKCIAGGDRHAAAAAKLGISESALKARLTSARDRLMARTTAEAIQRAKDYRLL
ncbi:helix-turn-helix transcriptional regulator [Phaeovulum sp.]|uniref:helix-turn-helix transcriptional regulator n=1 Tax=Phaeovulum sp. TaxID=2934796 RepID=UPI00272F8B07|nr:autoinducer binding domain-containing protein [Phaeovulum sp.]MDP1668729.1 autoinducer binding domain-containing protein [Phaeovulum sp.]MDP2063090.1 autoinducer binding domain-containing protein [Phaeovulum sp.]MDP3860065.1 autoinducer binding domain-containing protein [Phaeovulum sp.]MDZ4120545.1 autoinducer binding domain-containing protein [Phaeovulum sp.]